MEETKRCPYCGEEILAVAKKCKHCGEWLEIKANDTKVNTTKPTNNKVELHRNPLKGEKRETVHFKFLHILILIVLGIFLAYGLYSRHGNPQKARAVQDSITLSGAKSLEKAAKALENRD